MNDLLEPPAERDLPPRRAARMRAELLAAARGPGRRLPRRLLVTVAAVLIGIATVSVTLEVRHENRTQVLAMSPGELDPTLRRAAERCMELMEPRDGAPQPAFVPVSLADVTLASQRGPKIVVLFLNKTGYMGCELERRFGQTVAASVGGLAWPHRGWLPGPVQRLNLTSTEPDSGAVSVLGRVSARVHRLVLEHGNGRTTTARLRDGAFGLISATDDVRSNAELVSYDPAGREIDRRPLFGFLEDYDRCYTDPAGKVIYGEPGPAACLPAEPWTR